MPASVDRLIGASTTGPAKNKLPVIYGHTHAPFLRNIDKRLKEPTLIHHRINTGSCIQQGSVTAIEISPVCAEDREYFGQVRPLKAFSAFTGLVIRLVEWRMRFVGTRPVSATHIDDLAMGVQKHVLDIIPLGDFWWASTTAKDDDLDADESDD